MISRHPAAQLSSPRHILLLLLLAGCAVGPAAAASAAPEPVARPPASSARVPAKMVPLPLPRPEDLGEEETELREDEEPAVVAPLPANPPFMAVPDKTPKTFAAPPPPGSTPPRTSAPPAATVGAEPRVAPGTLPQMCAALVAQRAILAAPAPSVTVKPGCSLPSPVQLNGVRLNDGTVVAFQPAAILRCEAVAQVAQWVRDDIGPAVATIGSRLETLKVAASYDCRPRNRIIGAKMSEHGQGTALDVGGFVLEDKRVIEVKGTSMPLFLQAAMKASACMKFSTVLGPGSDGYHEDHVHVDMAVRRLDIKLCRWTLKPPPAGSVPVAAAPAHGSESAAVPAPAAAPSAPVAAESAEPAEAEDEEAVPLPPRRPSAASGSKPTGTAKPSGAAKPSGKSSSSSGKPSGPLWGPNANGLYSTR